jgi:hypothetical protein
MLVPTPFWATADFDVPIELWRERIGPAASKIVLAAGMEVLLQAYPGAKQIENDLASLCGFAAASLHRGADQIYLFNYMDPNPIQGGPEAYRTLLEKGLGLDVAAHAPRRHVVTYRDTVPPGMSNGAVLPIDGHKGGAWRLYVGPAPKNGRVLFIAGLAARDHVVGAGFEVSLNGKPCKAIADCEPASQFPNSVRAVRFECPLDSVRDGYNDLRVQQQPDQTEQQIVWAELRIEPAA